jgi:hypothetical protein
MTAGFDHFSVIGNGLEIPTGMGLKTYKTVYVMETGFVLGSSWVTFTGFNVPLEIK